jgi:hypothetical protein
VETPEAPQCTAQTAEDFASEIVNSAQGGIQLDDNMVANAAGLVQALKLGEAKLPTVKTPTYFNHIKQLVDADIERFDDAIGKALPEEWQHRDSSKGKVKTRKQAGKNKGKLAVTITQLAKLNSVHDHARNILKRTYYLRLKESATPSQVRKTLYTVDSEGRLTFSFSRENLQMLDQCADDEERKKFLKEIKVLITPNCGSVKVTIA